MRNEKIQDLFQRQVASGSVVDIMEKEESKMAPPLKKKKKKITDGVSLCCLGWSVGA